MNPLVEALFKATEDEREVLFYRIGDDMRVQVRSSHPLGPQITNIVTKEMLVRSVLDETVILADVITKLTQEIRRV